MDSQNEQSLTYGHVSLPDNTNASSLNQALGSHAHLAPPVGQRSYPDTAYRGLQDSPTTQGNVQPVIPGQQQQPPPGGNFSAVSAAAALKRKSTGAPPDGVMVQVQKRRIEGEDGAGDGFDADGAGGAKHWTDEEKTKLFEWLMGPGQDEHWNSLRATKNSCLRECAVKVFGGKKTYQALKGCYERNFNLFKQIYAFESWNAHNQPPVIIEGDRMRHYEQRLVAARKAGCDVGNITARVIETWHRKGWYQLFYKRWHGDPATTRPIVHRHSVPAPSGGGGGEDDNDDDPGIDYSDPLPTPNGINGLPSNNAGPSSSAMPMSPPDPMADPLRSNHMHNHQQSPSFMPPPPRPGTSEPTVTFAIPNSMFSAYLQLLQTQTQLLQTQTQNAKLKLDLLRRRDEQDRANAVSKHRAELATQMLANPSTDPSLRETAVNYLKGLFKD